MIKISVINGDQDTTGSGGKAYTNPSGADFNDDYHVFGINWSPDKIEWYVDGVIYNTLDLTNPTWSESAKNVLIVHNIFN